MKKRLRKKLGIAEFYRPWFAFHAHLTPMADGDQAAFVSRFIEESEKYGLICEGAIGEDDLEVCMDTGAVDTDNAARREAFLTAIKSWPEFVDTDASELN